MKTSLSNTVKYDYNFREAVRGGDIPDCRKYKELLESPDKEIVTMAIELLKLEGVNEYQIRRCNEQFLHSYYWEGPFDLD